MAVEIRLRKVDETVVKIDPKKWEEKVKKYNGDYREMMWKEYKMKEGTHYDVKKDNKIDLALKVKGIYSNRFLRDMDAVFLNYTKALTRIKPDPDGYVYDNIRVEGKGKVINTGVNGKKPEIKTPTKKSKIGDTPTIEKNKPVGRGKKGVEISDKKVEIIKRRNDKDKEKLLFNISDYIKDKLFKDLIDEYDVDIEAILLLNTENRLDGIEIVITDLSEVEFETRDEEREHINNFVRKIKSSDVNKYKYKVIDMGIDAFSQIYVKIEITDTNLLKKLVKEFKLDEIMNILAPNIVNEETGYKEALENKIIDIFYNDIKHIIESIEVEVVESLGIYRCYFVFKDSINEEDIPDNITILDTDGMLIGYDEVKETDEIKYYEFLFESLLY